MHIAVVVGVTDCDDQEPEELFEVLSQCLLSAVDRDAISGWGAVVHIM